MKILIVGADSPNALERYYLKHLKEYADVKIFPAQNMFMDYYYKSVIHKIIFRSGFSFIYRTINSLLINEIKQYQPDILFVFKGMEVLPSTLKWCRANGIKLANYNPDHPFIFSSKGSGNHHVSLSIKLYDIHFTYDKYVKQKIEAEYQIQTEVVPFGFDIEDSVYNKICNLNNEIHKACFVGSPDRDRVQFIKRLADNGVHVDVYGPNWDRYLHHRHIAIFPPVYEDQFWYTLRRYRVQLNMLRKHNLTSHNMRSFEVPGVGGILLAPYTEDHAQFFDPDSDIYLYTNFSTCIHKIHYLLSLSNDDAMKIRIRARNKSILSGYTYKERVISVFNYLKSLNNK
ncbi:MAG: glycosyltransferase [Thermoflavifilum sp.]|uniref:CgeB family protein n=1 Tax=Thermoflavifilum sp. TaxID=1968839 RepID=UPI0018A3B440|nr:glycosyltransferase [Thermoflavifilum sp.]QOR76691.1 MAG: glycosyltransferase [Thermoflavifilum sp.]